MKRKYRLEFKKMACELLDRYDNSPIRVSRELSVPIKTFEKWVQCFKKNAHCFDEEEVNYEAENKLLRKKLREKDETIEMLKKVYAFFTEKEKS